MKWEQITGSSRKKNLLDVEQYRMKLAVFKSVVPGLIAGLFFTVSTVIADDFPEVTLDGLHRLADSKLAVVYAKEGVDLSVYSKVWLVDASVAFKKNWQRDQNRSSSFKVRTKDMEKMKSGLAELFIEVFTEKLTEAGTDLVTKADHDVLIVRPAIINLDAKAPDVATTNRSYQLTSSAGEMTLYVELYDSVTGDLLAKALDRKADRESAYFQWQTKGSNRAAAKRVLTAWADTLSAALSDAQSSAGNSGEAEPEAE